MNCLINRTASLLSLKEYQTRIVPESDEDEGARRVGLEECLKAQGE